ncbi:MAG TPA: metal ABC transporter permease [Candidatus Binatia bacterium]|nr:metal ABC transporter permease [Candidatus Binatia bacterium]
MSASLGAIFGPGFFGSAPVHAALAGGAIVAVVTGAVGLFTVLRSQAFAGHALGEVGATGGAVALLAGTSPLYGYLGIAIAAGAVIELLGVQRPRARDLATGLVLGAGLGLAALFLYLDTTASSTTGAPVTVLFGSLFAVSQSMLPEIVVLSAVSLAIVVACYRMLLLSSLSADLAAARGVPVRVIGVAYLVALAVAVSLAAATIGAVLATALVIGPPASALRLTKRPGLAVLVASVIGIVAVWLGVLLAYDSFYWPPAGTGWPVSFFVVADVFAFYLLSGAVARLRQSARRQRRAREVADVAGG